MACGEELASQNLGVAKELTKLEVTIAESAWIGCSTPAVFGDEVCNDHVLHFFREIEDKVRYVQKTAYRLRVFYGPGSATPSLSKTHGDPNNPETTFFE